MIEDTRLPLANEAMSIATVYEETELEEEAPEEGGLIVKATVKPALLLPTAGTFNDDELVCVIGGGVGPLVVIFLKHDRPFPCPMAVTI